VPHVPITLLYGSITTLILGVLGINVSRARGNKKANLGDTPDPDLLRVIRAHGNCAEWAPALVGMLLILELSGASGTTLNLFGLAIVLARLFHGAGVLTKNKISVVGASLTYLLILAMPIYGLVLHFHG